jgi:hypothetical protein
MRGQTRKQKTKHSTSPHLVARDGQRIMQAAIVVDTVVIKMEATL